MKAIDNTWTIMIERSDEAGKELARTLLFNKAGNRPVTLIGYSFGARVIYSCLRELAVYQQKWEDYQEQKRQRQERQKQLDAQRGKILRASSSDEKKDGKPLKSPKRLPPLEFDREPASIVEDAILMGLPNFLNLLDWRTCREMVSGRLVNAYSRQDKVLLVMFKYNNLLHSYKPVCGNCTVALPGIENVDVSDLVVFHQDYCFATGEILQRIRHGQPIRMLSDAYVDEVAFMKMEQEKAEKSLATSVDQRKNKGKEEMNESTQDIAVSKLETAATEPSNEEK